MIKLSNITDEELLQIVNGARKFDGAYMKLVIPVQYPTLQDDASEEDTDIVSEAYASAQDVGNFTEVQTSTEVKENEMYQPDEGICDITDVKEKKSKRKVYVEPDEEVKMMRKRRRTCFVCDNVYANHRECGIHYFNAHILPKNGDLSDDKDPSKYYCGEDGCSSAFQNPVALWDHTLGHANIFEHICPEENCNMTFPCRKMLYDHKGKYHSTGIKALCVQCGATFTSKSSLKRHMMCHEGIKPFACSLCGKCFATKSALKRHSQTHGSDRKNQDTYQCNSCNGTYLSARSLQRHKAIMHSGDIKDHACEECGKSFCLEQSLRRHMKTHTGKKPYECTMCKSSFTEKHSLTRHQKSIHDITPID